ncbi:hypothetical protein [Alkalispirochaeta alkalica]|uniref:hypothetical protein n=1 Tax=Alkalispirochaeta alkalica TaxID=46356 RepID=UPI0003717A85|nr:hypothetical protein [Alkalispirochaeta alkalica]
MKMITSRMVYFKEYTSYRFENPENPDSLVGVKEPQRGTEETAAVDVEDKWVYVVRSTRYIPGDGVAAYINEIKPRAGSAYPLPIYEQEASFPCWSFFCLSPIRLSLPRQEALRRQVQAITKRENASLSPRCDRLLLLPLTTRQEEDLQGTWLSTFSAPRDVERIDEEKNHTTTVYLHDYAARLQEYAERYEEYQERYKRFIEEKVRVRSPRTGDNEIHARALYEALGLNIDTLLGSNPSAQRCVYSNEYRQWKEQHREGAADVLMPMEQLGVLSAAILDQPVFHASLIDYDYSSDPAEQQKGEIVFGTAMERLSNTMPVFDVLKRRFDEADEKVQQFFSDYNPDESDTPKIDDLTAKIGEDNWTARFISGARTIQGTDLPLSEGTTCVLEILSHAIAMKDTPLVVWKRIVDRRYKTGLVSTSDANMAARRARYPNPDAWRDAMNDRYSHRYGHIEAKEHDGIWYAEYQGLGIDAQGKRRLQGIHKGVESFQRAYAVFQVAMSLYDLTQAEGDDERLSATIRVAENVVSLASNMAAAGSLWGPGLNMLLAAWNQQEALAAMQRAARAQQPREALARAGESGGRAIEMTGATMTMKYVIAAKGGAQIGGTIGGAATIKVGGLGAIPGVLLGAIVALAGALVTGLFQQLAGRLRREDYEQWLEHTFWGRSYAGEGFWANTIGQHGPDRTWQWLPARVGEFRDDLELQLFAFEALKNRYEVTLEYHDLHRVSRGFFRSGEVSPLSLLEIVIDMPPVTDPTELRLEQLVLEGNGYRAELSEQVRSCGNLLGEAASTKLRDAETGRYEYRVRLCDKSTTAALEVWNDAWLTERAPRYRAMLALPEFDPAHPHWKKLRRGMKELPLRCHNLRRQLFVLGNLRGYHQRGSLVSAHSSPVTVRGRMVLRLDPEDEREISREFSTTLRLESYPGLLDEYQSRAVQRALNNPTTIGLEEL